MLYLLSLFSFLVIFSMKTGIFYCGNSWHKQLDRVKESIDTFRRETNFKSRTLTCEMPEYQLDLDVNHTQNP
jgi:hypothetical protein